MNIQELKTKIQNIIKSNGKREITGAKLQEVLLDSVDTLNSTKQDVISDLADIRTGASKGATAVQPDAISDMETQTHASSTYQNALGLYVDADGDICQND